MRSNSAVKFEETEVIDQINPGDVRDIEDLFSQILFDTWLAERNLKQGEIKCS